VRDAARFWLEQSWFAGLRLPEPLYILVPSAMPSESRLTLAVENDPLDNLYCLRCSRELEAGQKSVAVYLFAQTVGVRPRQKSAAQRICFCPQCSVSLAMGPAPEGALNIAAWQMIRDIVGSDPALTEAAWESLHGIEEGLLPATGTDGARPARAGAYFEF
jgi:hypothetical protein